MYIIIYRTLKPTECYHKWVNRIEQKPIYMICFVKVKSNGYEEIPANNLVGVS